MKSSEPPGGAVTTIRTGLVGYDWARQTTETNANNTPTNSFTITPVHEHHSRENIVRGARRDSVLDRNRDRLDFPDLAHVLAYRAVGRELPHARGVEDRHARPSLGIAPRRVDRRLAFRIRRVIRA